MPKTSSASRFGGVSQGLRKLGLVQVVLVLALAVGVLFWRVVFLGEVIVPADILFIDPVWEGAAPEAYRVPQNYLLADQIDGFYVWHRLAAESLQAHGTLPLWNPYEGAGQPLVGNAQSALFYPPNWLLRWLSAAQVATVRAIFNLLFAGVFAFLLCRKLEIGRIGALLAAVAFMLCGPLIVWLGYPHANVLACLPFLAWAGEGLLQLRRTLLWSLLLSVGVALAVLGGHPETTFHVALISAVYWLARLTQLRATTRSKVQLLASWGAAWLLGLMLAAVQLLPFAESLLHSSTLTGGGRGVLDGGLYYADWWQRAATAVTLFCPNFFGSPVERNYVFPLPLLANYNEQSLYIGVVPLTLAVGGIFGRRRGPASIMALLALVCLGVAWRLPGFEALNHLPLFSLVGNGRLILPFAFLASILSGFGWQQLQDCVVSHGQRNRRVAVAAAAVLALVCAVPAAMALVKWAALTPRFDLHLSSQARHLVTSVFSLRHFRTAAPTAAALAVAAASLSLLCRVRPRFFGLAIVAIALAELLTLAWGYNPTVDESILFPSSDVTDLLQQETQPFRVVQQDMFRANYGTPYHITQVGGYDLPVDRRFSDVYRAQGGLGRDYQQRWSPEWPLVDWMNVKYVITPAAITLDKFILLYERGPVKVYRNRDALPRAYLVREFQVVPDDAQALEVLTSAALDLRRCALLAEELPSDQVKELIGPASDQADRVEFVAYETDRVVLRVSAHAAGLLVMSDSFAPGWKALVDGHESPVLRANYAFRAVFLSQGEHTVAFVYQPFSFRLGATLSVAGLLVLVAGCLVLGLRRAGDKASGLQLLRGS